MKIQKTTSTNKYVIDSNEIQLNCFYCDFVYLAVTKSMRIHILLNLNNEQ